MAILCLLVVRRKYGKFYLSRTRDRNRSAYQAYGSFLGMHEYTTPIGYDRGALSDVTVKPISPCRTSELVVKSSGVGIP